MRINGSRKALSTIVTTLMILVFVVMIGVAALSFSNGKMITFKQLASSTFSTISNKVQESLVIENVGYYTNAQSLNVTLTNTGYEGINIQNVTVSNSNNKVINLNYTAANVGSTLKQQNAIALDAKSSFSIGQVSPYTYTHTVGAGLSNSILVVGVSVTKHNGITVFSIIDTTDNNAALKKAIAFSGGSGIRAEVWYLTNPPSGANSIKITFSGAIDSDGATVGTVSLSGVDQNNPIGATNKNGAINGNPSASITTINDNAWLIDTVAYDIQNDAATSGSGQTQQWQLNGGSPGGMEGFGSTKPTTTHGSNSMSWTVAQSNNWGMVVAEIKPASTSGSTSSSTPLVVQGGICGILPRQSCTISLNYHCFCDPVSISVTTSHGSILTTQLAPVVPWYNSQWQFRKEITINNAEVNGTLTSFPVLININDTSLVSNAQSSGNDILFTACDGKTPLNFEIEKYNSATGSLQAWVEIPTLYSTPNDIIYMYYGNHNNIQPYVTLTLSNSQGAATPVPFQQEITFNPSQYTSSEATNLGNIRFCADLNCNSQLYSWLETCTPSCTNTATQATAWVKLTSAIPANGAQRIYMVFQPTSTNFDGNYWGESWQISTSYDNIANVMNTGLLDQIYYYGGGTCSSGGQSNQNHLYGASLGNGITINGCASFVSSTNPTTTSATGSSQNVNGGLQSNVLFNYQIGYSGGGPWPNPPVSDTTKSWNAKAVGWAYVPSHTAMDLELDDGGAIGSSTNQGGFTTGGANWLGGSSNPNNVISAWRDQGATPYSAAVPSLGDNRIETDYYENGGQVYFGMWSNMTLNYYSFTYPPNGVMPSVTNSPWDSNYVGVWHFKEDPSGTPPQMKDSTVNANHLTSSGMNSANQVPGKIDGSLNFASGSNQYLSDTSATGMPANNGIQTESAWFLVSSNPSSTQDILSLQAGGGSAVKIGFTSSNFAISTGSGTLVTVSPPTAGTWHYAVYTYDGTTNRLYIDGVQVASSTTTPNSGTPNSLYVGTLSGLTEFYSGQIDETRISTIARSSSWIYTEYNNQASPSSFYTVGPQQAETDPRTSN